MSNNLQKQINAKKSKVWIIILPVIAAALAVAVLLYLDNDINEYTFTGEGAQHYMDNSYKVGSGSEMKLDEDNSVKLTYEGVESDVANIPVYLNDEDALVLTVDMIYVNPANFDGYCFVPALSEISSDHGNITVKCGKAEKTLSGGVLYDGNDLFIFLDCVTVTFNGSSVDLGRLSYAEAEYQNMIMIYDAETGKCYYDSIQSELFAKQADGDYTVNLLTDSFENYKGENYLFFNNLSDLYSIFD